VSASRELVLAILRAVNSDPEILAEVRTLIAHLAPAPERREPASRLTTEALAEALNVSRATINRACRDGLPHEYVGTSRRFGLEEARAWFLARGRRRLAEPDVDAEVEAIARRNGLRVVPRR
jgi:hypothetical protein